MKYAIFPPEELIEDARVTLPLSKSMSTRALILDTLASGHFNPEANPVALCDDTKVMAAALQQWDEAAEGTPLRFDLQASGAALRFLTAFFASRPGADVTLTGCERLCQRPMKPLVDALRQCGASVEYLAEEGYAPLRIKGQELTGGTVTIDATVSSQFISALLMIAPTMKAGLDLHFEGEPVSLPYITMTLGLMALRGVEAEREPLRVGVAAGRYTPCLQAPEGDWSAAAFWYEVSALSAGWITMTNLKADSLQGDKAAARFFSCLGVETVESEEVEGALDLTPSPEVYGRLDLDLTDNPDVAPALAVTCSLIGVPFKFTGLHNLAMKECDRLGALAEEMNKLGRNVEKVRDFGLEWDGKSHPVREMQVLSAHGDHRMAMALAPVSVYIPGIIIDGVETVSKSYPDYWEQLRGIGFKVIEVVITEDGKVVRADAVATDAADGKEGDE